MKLAAIIIAGAFIVGACLFFAARAAEHGSVSVAALAGVVAFVTFAAAKALAGLRTRGAGRASKRGCVPSSIGHTTTNRSPDFWVIW
jgi:hypothetical protein